MAMVINAFMAEAKRPVSWPSLLESWINGTLVNRSMVKLEIPAPCCCKDSMVFLIRG